MTGEVPYHESEFVSDEELIAVRVSNQEALEARYQEDCNILRADAILKLTKHKAMNEAIGWCIFHLTDMETSDSSVATIGNYKEVLLLAHNGGGIATVDGHNVPTIRLITNEPFLTEEGLTEWLSIDFSLDSDNDCMYSIDATDFANTQDVSNTVAPLFLVNKEGNLTLSKNFQHFTPIIGLCDTDSSGEEVVLEPFGYNEYVTDRLHCIDVARQLLDEIMQREPDYIHSVSS